MKATDPIGLVVSATIAVTVTPSAVSVADPLVSVAFVERGIPALFETEGEDVTVTRTVTLSGPKFPFDAWRTVETANESWPPDFGLNPYYFQFIQAMVPSERGYDYTLPALRADAVLNQQFRTSGDNRRRTYADWTPKEGVWAESSEHYRTAGEEYWKGYPSSRVWASATFPKAGDILIGKDRRDRDTDVEILDVGTGFGTAGDRDDDSSTGSVDPASSKYVEESELWGRVEGSSTQARVLQVAIRTDVRLNAWAFATSGGRGALWRPYRAPDVYRLKWKPRVETNTTNIKARAVRGPRAPRDYLSVSDYLQSDILYLTADTATELASVGTVIQFASGGKATVAFARQRRYRDGPPMFWECKVVYAV